MANKDVRRRNWRRYHLNAPKESVFQDRVMRDLRKIPKSWWQKINDRVSIGVADIHGGVNGYSVVIELKTKYRLTPLQYRTLEKADRAGCQSFCATPENWAEIYAFLLSLAEIPPPPVASLRKPARIPIWTLPANLSKSFANEPD